MASETVTSLEQASKHDCCGGKAKGNSATPADVKAVPKPPEAEKAPAPTKTSGSCCGRNSHS